MGRKRKRPQGGLGSVVNLSCLLPLFPGPYHLSRTWVLSPPDLTLPLASWEQGPIPLPR